MRTLTRRRIVTGAAFGAGAVGFMLALGWWRTGAPPQSGLDLLPIPIPDMSFNLTDHRGLPFAPAEWLGRPTMVFFGFTFCPDVCPTTLSDISDWLTDLGPEADRLNVALISVDPERDTPAVLAEYLSNFDPRITGLTGQLPEVEKAAADFRAKFEKLPRDGDYTMNHTAGVFLFHADGRFASIIDFHEDRRFAIPKIRRILA
jgi:protein SCO1